MGRAQETVSVNVGGLQITKTVDVNTDNEVSFGPAAGIAAAKSGNLTTRTSDTVGTLTMAAGHGIITGDILDIYWTAGTPGMRRGVTVGTVAGNDVPFSVGAGDNLPADESAITAMVPIVELGLIPFATVKGIAVESAGKGVIRLTRTNDAVEEEYVFTAAGNSVWVDGSGVTNPITADVNKIKFSNAAASAVVMTAKAVYN